MKSTRELQRWFKQHITDAGHVYTLDKHQAHIVLDHHKNTLVTARAGSGKTRTIVAKITYLLAHEKIPPENIIVFAFNRKAKTEINERLTKISFDGKPLFKEPPAIATTFHAFAYQILGGKSVIGHKIIAEEQEDKIILSLVQHYLSLNPDSANLASASTHQAIANSNNSSAYQATSNSTTLTLNDRLIANTKQFIVRAEQKFFQDYQLLQSKIAEQKDPDLKSKLTFFYQILQAYQKELARLDLINFNQMVARSAKIIARKKTSYSHIFVDEYQDFSLLFLTLIQSLRKSCPTAHLLTVGDDWQAINRFAGSDVEYFTHFEKYFPEDCQKLFIPTNYRSGKKIVKNANFFMSTALKDFQGCKAGNKKSKAKIFVKDIGKLNLPQNISQSTSQSLIQNAGSFSDASNILPPSAQNVAENSSVPLLLQNYFYFVTKIIQENPGKSIKILHRNNDLSFRGYSLESFCNTIVAHLSATTNPAADLAISPTTSPTPSPSAPTKSPPLSNPPDLTFSTVHRSKGLESDIVILLEIDAEKFPGKDKSGGLYEIFGDTEKTLFEDEARLFYVALTRPKEKLYILTKTATFTKENKKLNFLSYLNTEWLEYL